VPKSNIKTIAAAALLAPLAAAGAVAQAQADPLIPGVTGCGAPGEKQAGGAVVGALAGGLLGNSVSGHNRTTGTLVGAAVGAAAGSAVGCQMQHNDEQRAAAAAPRPDRGDDYELARGIAPARFDALDETLVATRTTPLRAAPDGRSARVGKLHRGERFEAMAQVHGGDWLLVGRDGVGVGYVPGAYARSDGDRYAQRN